MQFKDVLVAPQLKEQIINQVKLHRVSHAQLFHAQPGSHAFALAIAMAQYMCCEHPTDEDSCGHCPSCIQFEKLTHPDLHLYFPNCITATFDDGVNDYFFMSDPSLVSEFEIWIYGRWGMLVYHSTDPHFQWDGTVNGKVAANNEFSWRAFAKPKTEDKKYSFFGSVLVL